ncbi:hypothetical protein [Streptomyces sp. KL116D]|uniref:hypothetical protein n=1 Tax=Streptomyces sp. KL116D TaxID=3045152 RepID=UPI0035582D15
MDGERWLAACHTDPSAIRAQWATAPHLASIPAGIRFDVLRLLQPLALNVLWELGDVADKTPVLEEHCPPRPVLYLLAEPGTAAAWPPDAHSTWLTTGHILTCPSPDADAIAGVQRHAFLWRTPPDGIRQPAATDLLLTAYRHARDPERQAARIRAARSVFWGTQRARHT